LDFSRRLLTRAGFFSPSLDGGLPLFELFKPNLASGLQFFKRITDEEQLTCLFVEPK
jgi:hypothetical protein